MKKIILCFNLLVFVFDMSFGQTIDPDQTYKVWGGEIVEYERGPFDNCTINWKVEKGVFPDNSNATNFTPNKTITKVKVKWNNEATTIGRITFDRFDCDANANNSTERNHIGFTIMSLNGFQVSNVSISSPISVCESSSRIFSISKIAIPNSASSKFASGYEWTIPSGWTGPSGQTGTFLINDPNAFSVSLTPSACASGAEIVRVRAYTNTEGKGTPHYSSLSNPFTVVRISSPEISIPIDIKCGVPFTATVEEVPCATSYDWTVPQGWTISGTGSTRTITPGSISGTISVNIPVTGGCAISASKAISTVFEPVINGSSNICSPGNFFQLGDIPAGATATWSVSNPGLFSGSGSGSGTSVTLTPANSSVMGKATLTFNVSGVCGSKTLTKQIWVGNPDNSGFYMSGSAFYFYQEVGPMGTFESRTAEWIFLRPELNVQVANILEYQWAVTGSHSSGPLTLTGSELSLRTANTPDQMVTVSLRMRNSCGWGSWGSAVIWTRGEEEEPWRVYPNPASDYLTIEQDAGIQPFSVEPKKTTLEYSVKIYNESGNEVMSLDGIRDKKLVIPVSQLKKGFYIVRIIQDGAIIRRRIRIE